MSKQSRVQRARKGCFKFLLMCLLAGFALVVVGVTALVAILNHFSKGLPEVSKLRQYEPSETTRIYASGGELIATLFRENRTWTPYEEISPNVINAVVAVEDSRFYDHRGVDPIGVARAAYYDVFVGGAQQGASTVTMQLARNLFLTPTRTMERKIREVLLALQIEKKFTKNEIMELYLNQIYFGSGAYGIQSAASTYFNKKAKDLTLAEAALLAGLPQAPSDYSPFVSERSAKHRQIRVLGRMVHLGLISWSDYRAAIDETRRFKFKRYRRDDFQLLKVPYFTTYVLKQLYNRYDEELLYRGGLKIHTTVDLKLQRKLEQAVGEMVRADARAINVDNGAVVMIENENGFIRSMVGGTKWTKENQFNRAWQARRQPGSSFKIFVYTAAIEAGYSPDTIIPDSEVTFTISPTETWTPKNSDHAYMGAIPMWKALMHSRNVVAVKLLNMVGPERVIELAYKMGIRTKLYPHLSLALGALEVSPLEMASAYSVLPNAGIKVEPTAIKIIYDSEGNVVEDNTFPKKQEILRESTAHIMIGMMKRVVEKGTGTNARLPGREAAGKTGTTDDFRDAWFVGFTPQFTAAVWVGNDDNSKMWRAYGGDLPARIWRRCMLSAHEGKPKLSFSEVVDGKVKLLICRDSKRRANTGCLNTYEEFFKKDSLPSFCKQHGKDTGVEAPTTPGPTDQQTPANPDEEFQDPEDVVGGDDWIPEEDLIPPPDNPPQNWDNPPPAPPPDNGGWEDPPIPDRVELPPANNSGGVEL